MLWLASSGCPRRVEIEPGCTPAHATPLPLGMKGTCGLQDMGSSSMYPVAYPLNCWVFSYKTAMALVAQIRSFQQLESTVMPYLQVLSEFREGVRKIAREKKGKAPCCAPHPCCSPSAGLPVVAVHSVRAYKPQCQTGTPLFLRTLGSIVLGQSCF